MTMSFGPPGQAQYAPSRDVLYLLPNVLDRAFLGLLGGSHSAPCIKQVLAQCGTSEEQLARAVETFTEFFTAAQRYEKPFEGLESCGFFKLDAAASTALLAWVGLVSLSAFWRAARNGTELDHDQHREVVRYRVFIDLMVEYAGASRWKRFWLRRKFRRLRFDTILLASQPG